MTTHTCPARPLPAVLGLPPHRSVLRLGPGSRLLGLDPATSLAVDDLPPALAEMLDELGGQIDGGQIAGAELVARAVERGCDAAATEALLRELAAAGALVDATERRRPARHRTDATVLVTGAGPLAVGIAVGLAHAGVGTVHIDTTGTVLGGDLGTGCVEADRGLNRLAATAAAVRRLVPAARAGPPPLRLVPELVVLADALAPEPARVAALHAHSTAHLSACLRDGVGIIGPLVLPGRSTCLGCIELQRRACDPEWSTISAQLVGRQGGAEPACVAATAAMATAQALAALDTTLSAGPAPPTLDTTLELDTIAATVTRRTWRPSPECCCGAARDVARADRGG